MSEQARTAIGSETIEVVADPGCFSGDEILTCEEAGITVYPPKPTRASTPKDVSTIRTLFMSPPTTSNVCPAGGRLTYRYTNEEDGKTLRCYWTTACQACALKNK
jgi:hypothetical protein